MYKVEGYKITYDGVPWCNWLTLNLTPTMQDDLVEQLNIISAKGYDNGYNDGVGETKENIISLVDNYHL